MVASLPRRESKGAKRRKLKLEVWFPLIILVAILLTWRTSRSLTLEESSGGNDVFRIEFLSGHNHSKPSDTAIATTKHNETKPYFILHIGPPKTATTYLQCTLNELSKDLAEEDSYFFLGKACPLKPLGNNETGINGNYLIMGLNEGSTKNRGADRLIERLNYHRIRNNNIIYSNEGLTARMADKKIAWESLESMFQEWNVRVVVTYRHYFDWIRSFYYQTYKGSKKNHQKIHPSYTDFLDSNLRMKEAGKLSADTGKIPQMWGHHLAVTALKKFSAHFPDIQYQNLHDSEEDLVTDFVCRILPNADNTCRKLRNATTRKSEQQATRLSGSISGYRILEAALDQGIVRLGKKNYYPNKKRLADLIEQKIGDMEPSSLKDYLECPSQALVARLLNVSAQFETEFFELGKGKPMTTMEKEQAMDNQFALYRKNEAAGKYCDLSPALILKNEAWVGFLEKLK